MCPPSHFGVHYVINPWMEGQIDSISTDLAARQWDALRLRLAEAADVALMPAVAGLPDLVFTANAALVYARVAILSSFRYAERRPEECHFEAWLAEDGFQVHKLPREVAFEGAGDALLDRSRPLLWMGHGFRSDLSAKPYLEKALNLEIQPLRLVDSRFYHLDTCFCPLDGGRLMYFPWAFDPASKHAIESRVPADQRFEVDEEDAVRFACNAVNLDGAVILNRAGRDLKQWITAQGFELEETALSEFMRAGGAAKCLSLRLDDPPGCPA